MGRDRIVSSSEEMIELGKQIGSSLPPGSILALSGDLGAGKTTFVQGLAIGLGIQDPVQSPTFVYLNHYEGNLPLFHFDLYRLKGEEDFLGMGFEEYFVSSGICAIEWPERIPSLLPSNTVRLTFSHVKEGRRVNIL